MMNSNKDQAMTITTTNNNNNNNSSFTNTATSNNSSNTSSNNANNNNKSAEQAKGDGQPPSPPPLPAPGQLEKMPSEDNSTVFKSGPLYISSKGIGWTSWKKRWFILTRTSLVFYRSDPNAVPQKGSEVNLILGGIDLNNSGSVVVKADKKLLTVLFPDGRDGRAFTLKAETSEDLYEWKTALENALAKAPSATIVMGQNGILKNDQANIADGSQEQLKNKQPVKSSVIGRPILLALEDADGSPSFLEKALRFIEEHGIKVEGILRQAADVDDVEHRIREYEQGKTEFSAEEDAHVIGDCIKYILREMPSSPVPASCCTALLEAFRTDRSNRVNTMRAAICEAFPDPNRRLLQRILLMMQAVASNKAETRMSISAAAACMAPLLLRPLLAGDCEIDTNVNVGGDSSLQLLKAAAAANHAQAIVITLLEEYNTIFREDSMTPGLYSDSEEYGSEDELVTDDDVSYEDDEDYEDDDASQGSDAYTDEDVENASSTYSGTGDSGGDDLSETKEGDPCSSSSISSEADNSLKDEKKSLSTSDRPSGPLNYVGTKDTVDHIDDEPVELPRDANVVTALENRVTGHSLSTCAETAESDGPMQGSKRATVLGRTAARKNLSMESIDFKIDDEVDIQRLEASKLDLQKRISEEAEVNAALQANLEKRKKSLYERRIALEQDVARLQEQLQRERDKRTVLEAGLYKSKGPLLLPAATTDEKMRVDLEEITQADTDVARLKQKPNDFGLDLYQQREHNMQNSNSQGKLNDAGAASNSQLPGRSSSKPDSSMRRADLENDKKHEATSSSNRCPPQNERLVLAQKSGSRSSASTNSRRSGMRTEDISEDGNQENDKNYDSATSPNPSKNRPHRSSSKSRSSSKKCDTKTEGGSSASALTKLTTRLNFLKEKRGQIASELQNLDIGRGSGQTATGHKKTRGSESRQSLQNKGKGKGLESNSAENPETGGRAESRDLANGTGREGNSAASYEKRKKADGQSQQYTDEGRSLEDQRSK